MKFKIQKEKLNTLLNIAFIDKEYSDAMFRLKPNGLIINDPLVIVGVANCAVFKPEYFTEYEVETEETVIIPQSFHDFVKKNKTTSEEVTVYTTPTHLVLEAPRGSGKKDVYKDPLKGSGLDDPDSLEHRRKEGILPLKNVEYGLLPKKGAEKTFIGKLKVSDFNLPTPTDNEKVINFVADNDGLRIEMIANGDFVRELEIVEMVKEPTLHFKHKYDCQTLQSMIKQFEGQLWTLIDEKGYLNLTDKNTERSILFVLGETN